MEEEEDFFAVDNVLLYLGKALKNGIWKRFAQHKNWRNIRVSLKFSICSGSISFDDLVFLIS